MISSYILFIGGAAFAFRFVLPAGVKFLLAMGTDEIKPMINLESYVSFAVAFMLSFGLMFQLPLVVVILTALRIVTPQTLVKKRKVVVLGVFILAAILTPGPDILSQLMMAVPTLVLFELSIIFSYFFYRKGSRKNSAETGMESTEWP